MRAHFRQYFKAWLTLLALLYASFALIRAQYFQFLDRPTVAAILAALDHKAEADPRVLSLSGLSPLFKRSYALRDSDSSSPALRLVGAGLAAPCVENEIAARVREVEAAAAGWRTVMEGRLAYLRAGNQDYSEGAGSSAARAQDRETIRTAQARMLMVKGDIPGAMAVVRRFARSADHLRLIAPVHPMRERLRAANLCREAMALPGAGPALPLILDVLREINETAPRLTPEDLARDYGYRNYSGGAVMGYYSDYSIPPDALSLYWYLQNAELLSLDSGDGQGRSSDLNRGQEGPLAGRLRSAHWIHTGRSPIPAFLRPNFYEKIIGWGLVPAIRAHIRRAGEGSYRDPFAVGSTIAGLPNLDPATVRMMMDLGKGGMEQSWVSWGSRYWFGGRSLEAAAAVCQLAMLECAARMYRAAHGRWPGAVTDLVPAYVPVDGSRSGGKEEGYHIRLDQFHAGSLHMTPHHWLEWIGRRAPGLVPRYDATRDGLQFVAHNDRDGATTVTLKEERTRYRDVDPIAFLTNTVKAEYLALETTFQPGIKAEYLLGGGDFGGSTNSSHLRAIAVREYPEPSLYGYGPNPYGPILSATEITIATPPARWAYVLWWDGPDAHYNRSDQGEVTYPTGEGYDDAWRDDEIAYIAPMEIWREAWEETPYRPHQYGPVPLSLLADWTRSRDRAARKPAR